MESARGHTRHAYTEQTKLEQRWIESIAKGIFNRIEILLEIVYKISRIMARF